MSEPTERAEFIGGPWDGQIHDVKLDLQFVYVPGVGRYMRQERLRTTEPARCFRWVPIVRKR